jgi:uncharacterized protein (DUF433 family)
MSKDQHELLHRPRYSTREVVPLSGVPYTTLWSWGRGKDALLSVASGRNQWSFANVVEARVLNALRQRERVPELRRMIAFLQQRFNEERPLISERLKTSGSAILFDDDGILVDVIDPRGQIVIRRAFEDALRSIAYENGLASSIWLDPSRSLIRVDPRYRFGEPFLDGTSVPLFTLSKRHRQGESFAELAKDYDLKTAKVREAVKVYDALPRQGRNAA